MTVSASLWFAAWLLALTATAAITDLRAGVIPNWLTFATLAAAPLAHGASEGVAACAVALASALVCGIAPLILFSLNAMGGGDVKLLAALGALAGMRVGLELQFASYALALLYGIGALTLRGQLPATLARAGAIVLAPLSRGRRTAEAGAMCELRLGPAVFAATALVLLSQALGGWP